MASEGPEVSPLNLSPQTSPFIRRRFDQITPNATESHPWRRKRMKELGDGSTLCMLNPSTRERALPDVIDYSDPFSVTKLKEELDRSMYGSVTKDIEDLRAQRYQMMNSLLAFYPSLSSCLDFSLQTPTSGLHSNDPLNGQSKEGSQMMDRQTSHLVSREIIDLDDDCIVIDSPAVQDSKLLCKSFADIQGHGCKDTRSAKASHESIGYMEMSKVDNDLENHNNMQIPILDLDEVESANQIWTTQASRCSQEALNFEIPQVSQSQLDLDRGNNPTSDSGTTFHEVHSNEHGNDKFILALSVPRTVLNANRKVSFHYEETVLKKPIDENPINGFAGIYCRESKVVTEETVNAETESEKDKGVYVGVQDDVMSNNISSPCNSDEGLGDIWREMTVALECNKDGIRDNVEHTENGEGEECDHSFLLKDDLGCVCRVCGVIKKSIEEIFDYQWGKASKTTRTYMSESRGMKEREENDAAPFSGVNGSHDLAVADISVHPRHMKQMKPHQLEGFNFLVRNLMSDDPGGCILAHAPGSGKTFMIISFIQSFLAKFPNARPLVVLPKGILGTWKKEFVRWQVEDIPLYDFYSSKAESRTEQLDILEKWVQHKGIMFLGYQQFAIIVSKSESDAAASCQDILLKVPTILIMDEGHTPRNQDTDLLHSLEKVQTPRKIVLSGTLYQNHVKEVFNILNLVRPKFLKSDTSKAIKRRVMSRAHIGRKHIKADADAAFFDVVEVTLQNDETSKVKVAVSQDLREMTRNVLHYYKGDSLDELPGLVDFTVLLNLSSKQKQIVEKLKEMERFKRIFVGTAVYMHPQLKEFSENATMADKDRIINENKLNDLINKMDFGDGVKTKFFLNILGLCESSREKLLVFSQYLLPLKFLERLVVKLKGWSPRKEIFMINGDTSPEDREWSMERFNSSSDAKVFFGSIKACGEGISLVGASRILIMDVHLNPSVTRQAIGRAFRPGQVRKVYVYRLVASDSPEEENHNTSCRKDLVSKMWFEWSGYYANSNFDMETVDVNDCDDKFWESPSLRENVNVIKKR